MQKLTLSIFLLWSMTWPALSPVLAGPLHDAAAQGDLGKVRQLIEKGVDVTAVGKSRGVK